MRIGHGYDIHRLVKGRKLILAGIQVPYEKGLLGHSDADVLAHAVSDSILGAAALGDIGSHFPDTSDTFKDADSMILLQEVCKMLFEKSYHIENIDITVIAEAPKLQDYILTMRKNIAKYCAIDFDCVNIKATTAEKIGFTGDKEGICCHAVCLIK